MSSMNRNSSAASSGGRANQASPHVRRGMSWQEQKLQLQFEEERELLVQKHKDELSSVNKRAAKQLELADAELAELNRAKTETVCELRKKSEDQERSFLLEMNSKNEIIEQLDLEKTKAREKCDQLESTIGSMKASMDKERRNLLHENQELKVELDSMKQSHSNYVELYQKILDKKQDSFSKQIAELAQDLAREKSEAILIVENQKGMMEAQFEKERARLSQDKELLLSENSSLKRQSDELRSCLADKDRELEAYLKEAALKENDYQTKVALKKLVEDQREEMARMRKKQDQDNTKLRAKLQLLEEKYEERLQSSKMEFQHKFQDDLSKMKLQFLREKEKDMEYFETKIQDEKERFLQKNEEALADMKRDYEALQRQYKMDSEKWDAEQKIHLNEMQSEKERHSAMMDDIDRQYSKKCESLSEDFMMDMERKEKMLKNDFETRLEMVEQDGQIALEAQCKRSKVIEDDLEQQKKEVEHLFGRLRLQEAVWRTSYKQVKHLRCVQEAFKPAIAQKFGFTKRDDTMSEGFSPASRTTTHQEATSIDLYSPRAVNENIFEKSASSHGRGRGVPSGNLARPIPRSRQPQPTLLQSATTPRANKSQTCGNSYKLASTNSNVTNLNSMLTPTATILKRPGSNTLSTTASGSMSRRPAQSTSVLSSTPSSRRSPFQNASVVITDEASSVKSSMVRSLSQPRMG